MTTLKPARIVCAGNALLLALLWGSWYGWLAPSENYGIGMVMIGALPLLLLSALTLGGRIAGMAALGFLSLFYLAHGLTELMANPDMRLLASVSTLLSMLLFLTASHCLRIHRMQQPDRRG